VNDILRAYGRFDVAAGQFSVFPALSIKDGYINGYVKPMFSNLEVYNYQKDKNTGVLHQARELVIGGASHLFKNSSTSRSLPRSTLPENSRVRASLSGRRSCKCCTTRYRGDTSRI
jgi:hypothetical protein